MKLYTQEFEPQALLDKAHAEGHRLCGYYNENDVLDIDGHKIVVRRPIEGAEDMDLGFVREEAVLDVLRPHNLPVPKVLALSDNPYFFVENFIDGDVVNDTHPRGATLPHHFIPDVIALKNRVWQIDFTSLLHFFPEDWPESGDTGGFFSINLAKVSEIWQRYKDRYGPLYKQFGAPDEPLEVFDGMADLFAERPFVIAHSDIHRKNCIIQNGQTWFLDWERALIADPVYDIAVHMHKMYYSPEEDERFLRLMKETMPESFKKGMGFDLGRYLQLERVKSFIVDTVRGHQHLANPNERPDIKEYVSQQFSRKIGQVQDIWGGRPFTSNEIQKIMQDYSPPESGK